MSENRKELICNIVGPLCEWFENEHREMYWRSHPVPYYIWISEIMLQQTRVEAVRGYFERFIEELPDVESLAGVDDERLMKLWEGLGYYNRARNLKKAACVVMEKYGGEMPAEYEELKELPGIGEYTAGAVSSIAFGKAEPAVDGNVLRVFMRLMDDESDILKEPVKKELRVDLKESMPKDKPGVFNQALMELGAVVCLPNGLPKCEDCPVKEYCLAEKKGIGRDLPYAQSLPFKAPKKPRKIEKKTVLAVERNGRIAVSKRKEKGLLAGMWEFPNMDGNLKKKEVIMLLEEAGMEFEKIETMGKAKHVFSHIEWHMTGYRVVLKEFPAVREGDGCQDGYLAEMMPVLTDLLKECKWETAEVLKEEYSMPSAFEAYKKVLF
jgi:A/G-specific adenine glycosylase